MPGSPAKDLGQDGNYSRVGLGRIMTCKNCWENGHNVRSCKNQKKDPPPKVVRPRGRPRKVDKLESATTIGNTGLLHHSVHDCVEVHVVQENITAGDEDHVADQIIDQENETVGNEQLEQVDDMISKQHDVLSEQPGSEKESSDGEYEQPNRWCDVSNKRKKSERILKMKLSKPVYDEDGGGSTIDKPLVLD